LRPTRRAILARWRAGKTPVTALAEPFDMSLPAVDQALKVLENAGAHHALPGAQFRPCRLEPKPLKALHRWLEGYGQLWEERLEGLESYLRERRRR